MTEADLLAHFPRLYHMAEDGSWPSIQKHGLLSTAALLDLHQVQGDARSAILSQHRPECVSVTGPDVAAAVVRDQKPMSVSALEKCLVGGVTPTQWFELLNGRVFFWPTKERLWRLLNAEAYRDRAQVVLTLDTRTLVEAHRARIELSPINSGSTIMKPVERGLQTFLPIDQYPYEHRRKKAGRRNAVAELVVLGGVPDIEDHVLAVHRVVNKASTAIWRGPGTLLSEGP